MKYTWKSTITLPDKNLSSLETFTYEDTIGEPSIHSASKTELDKQIKDNIEFEYLDENGKFQLNKSGLIAYSHGEYLDLGKEIGTFGYSVKKKTKKPQKRRKKKVER